MSEFYLKSILQLQFIFQLQNHFLGGLLPNSRSLGNGLYIIRKYCKTQFIRTDPGKDTKCTLRANTIHTDQKFKHTEIIF